MADLGIMENHRLAGLGARQREALLEQLRQAARKNNVSGYPCSSCTRRQIWFEF